MASGDIIRLGGGTDFFKGTPIIQFINSNSSTYKDVFTINGKGLLVTLGVTRNDAGISGLEVVIDGTVVFSQDSIITGVRSFVFYPVVPFFSSLVIRNKTSNSYSNNVCVCCLLFE